MYVLIKSVASRDNAVVFYALLSLSCFLINSPRFVHAISSLLFADLIIVQSKRTLPVIATTTKACLCA